MRFKEKMANFKKLKSPVILIVFIVLFVYALSVFAILGWGILTSLKSYIDFDTANNVIGFPNAKWSKNEILFSNYSKVLVNLDNVRVYTNDFYSTIFGKVERPAKLVSFLGLLFNTFMYAGVACFVCCFTTMTMGFMCAKYKYKYSTWMYNITLVLMMLPIVGTYPSELALLRDLGIYDSLYGMIIQNMHFMGMYFLVWIAFYKGLSDTYFEAAEIDGASQIGCFLKIAFPLSAKTLGTIFLLNFMIYYNDYQTPLLYYPSYPTLAYGIYNLANKSFNSSDMSALEALAIPQKVAGCLILAMPAIVLFIAFKDILMGNVSLGGLKE